MNAIGIIYICFCWIGLIISVLLSVAFFTVFERHLLSVIQKRFGPTFVGIFGILQAISDGVKLILKESIFPRNSETLVFVLAPILSFTLALCLWIIIPLDYGYVIMNFELGILYIFTISSLSVHAIIMAGWSSNSKYALLGSLRSAAQMISYEVSLGITIISIVLLSGSLDLTCIVMLQKKLWNFIPLFSMFLLFYICILAETNRHPFDLPEAESELVSGYNVEYAAVSFALFFLAEYSNIIVMSLLVVIFFIGGWNFFISFDFLFFYYLHSIFLIIKGFFFMFVFVLVRGMIPRFRYDQLMRLGWKVFLPISLFFVVMLSSYLVEIMGFLIYLCA